MAPKGKAVAKAAVKAAAAPKAKAFAKAKAKAKAMMRPRMLVPRVRDGYIPEFLRLLRKYGYWSASGVRNARTVEQVAAFLFQNCDEDETRFWVAQLWYKCPGPLTAAIKGKWDAFMSRCKKSTHRGVGVDPTAVWAVSARGAVMGAI